MAGERVRVAIAHDHLVQRGGAERVVATMAEAFPGAPIYTSVYEPSATYPVFKDLDVRPLGLNRLGFFRHDHRRALPLLLALFPQLEVDADVLLCSSAGWAHSVRTTGRKVVYWYSPNRWIHSPKSALGGRLALVRLGLEAGRRPLRWWDRSAAATADMHLSDSTVVQGRVRALYGVESDVLHPPYMLGDDAEEAIPGIEPGFFLVVSRLQPYKNVEAVVSAFGLLPLERLVVVGTGSRLAPMAARAPRNVSFVGDVSDAQIRWAYRNAKALVAAALEDFGLTPVEAAAFGTPTAALRAGGYLDTIDEGRTGVFFSTPEPRVIAEAVRAIAAREWDPEVLAAHANAFSRTSFQRQLVEFVTRCAQT